jgi:DHA2 family multidrug resistance protein
MAQASGLINVIRQIGGSFGVAILGTLLMQRTIFHSAMFGQAVDPSSPAFAYATYALRYFAQHAVGGNLSTASILARSLFGSHIGQQAFVQAINDDFLIAGAITFIGAIPVFFLRTRKQTKTSKPVPLE